MRLIDTHVHINFDAFQPDLDDIAQAWRAVGVSHVVHSCVTPEEFPRTQALADRFSDLSFAVGLHPLDVDQWVPSMAEQIQRLAKSDSRVVAIGEMGLDSYKATNHDLQVEVFKAQLAIAHQLHLPVIIHCRDAARAAADIIGQFIADHGPVKGVMHCWSGTPEATEWFLDLGFFISFSGIVTFKNAHQVKESALKVPLNRLLVETDCPFLTPEPRRKERRNQPANVIYVARYLAELRQDSLEVLAEQTTLNAIQLFQLPISTTSSERNPSLVATSC
ncbi:MAG: TatD family hydrolase [Leptolyngbyaceae cyanobacterium]